MFVVRQALHHGPPGWQEVDLLLSTVSSQPSAPGRVLPPLTNESITLHGAKAPSRAWVDMLFDALDGMLEASRRRPLVFNLSLHPYLIGHAFRLQPFRRFLEHLAALRHDLWLARPGEIAAHALSLPKGTLP
jgi:hypothetical protein